MNDSYTFPLRLGDSRMETLTQSHAGRLLGDPFNPSSIQLRLKYS
jgi:hypothetical protein